MRSSEAEPRLHVAVLGGGASAEREVSLRSARAVSRALLEAGHRVTAVDLAADGTWRLSGPLREVRALPSPDDASAGLPALRAAGELRTADAGIDVVFVALHGPGGEDGRVQGLLDLLELPYTGSGVAASALAMDKLRTKEVLAHHGVATPEWESWDRATTSLDERARTAIERLGLPLVVKVPTEGSSFGIWFARTLDELRSAARQAFDHEDGRVLVERVVVGTEVTCAVVGNRLGPTSTLPLVEIVPDAGHGYFDYAAKYEGASAEICPARIDPSVADEVRRIAQRVHRLLGCDGLSRSDFILDVRGRPWFLELNTIPGMTAESLCPLAARAAGISFPTFCDRLVRLALER